MIRRTITTVLAICSKNRDWNTHFDRQHQPTASTINRLRPHRLEARSVENDNRATRSSSKPRPMLHPAPSTTNNHRLIHVNLLTILINNRLHRSRCTVDHNKSTHYKQITISDNYSRQSIVIINHFISIKSKLITFKIDNLMTHEMSTNKMNKINIY